MRTFKDILSVPQLFIFKLNHKYNLPLHLIIYNNDSVDVLPITSRCISDQVTKFPIRSRHDVSPIKSRSVPTKYVRSHDVFRTTYEMSDLIRIRIGSEGATDTTFTSVCKFSSASFQLFPISYFMYLCSYLSFAPVPLLDICSFYVCLGKLSRNRSLGGDISLV